MSFAVPTVSMTVSASINGVIGIGVVMTAVIVGLSRGGGRGSSSSGSGGLGSDTLRCDVIGGGSGGRR